MNGRFRTVFYAFSAIFLIMCLSVAGVEISVRPEAPDWQIAEFSDVKCQLIPVDGGLSWVTMCLPELMPTDVVCTSTEDGGMLCETVYPIEINGAHQDEDLLTESSEPGWFSHGFSIIGIHPGYAVSYYGDVQPCPDPEYPGQGLVGSYQFAENIYTSPLSSYIPFGAPFVYSITQDSLVAGSLESSEVITYGLEFERTPVDEDVFSSAPQSFVTWLPNLSGFSERLRVGVAYFEDEPLLELYQMDDQLWLVRLAPVNPWSIYRIERISCT
ncbi:MAG: hypothetical protein FWD55_05370 [Propionibacteriaceae bacterium]|nr:hypothetical protein [Propionibacteriaceae bacterium]